MAELLAESKYLSAALLDPAVCSAAEAVAASKAVAETGKKIETALEIALGKALRGQTHTETSLHILRILNLLEASGARLVELFQVELMAYPDKLVRSKAALLIGRATKNAAWIGRRLMDRDLRVQANAVEALWELDASESRPYLASKSKNNRVAGNAAVGLYRLGDTKVIRPLLEMAGTKSCYSACPLCGPSARPKIRASFLFSQSSSKRRMESYGWRSPKRWRKYAGARRLRMNWEPFRSISRMQPYNRAAAGASFSPCQKREPAT